MNERLESIISTVSATLLNNRRDKRAICTYYDKIFQVIRDAGFNEDVAHHWTIFALSRVYGSLRVVKAISA